MSYENFERKRTFITRSLSHCVNDVCPRILRLEYAFHVRDNVLGDAAEEVRMVYDCGYTSCLDVSGMDLLQTMERVLHALADQEAV